MSDVVGLEHEAGIVTLTMCERHSHNTFSSALVNGLVSRFGDISRSSDVKVVILTGYGNYFCCGGTKEELMSLHEGRARFSRMDFYRLLLDCKVPVISAMQGHAIGAGLAFGCFADSLVMAEESLYCASFMKYGFTPGFGATYIIPMKLGVLLGTEMLFTARNYHGAELKQRGAAPVIVRRADVLDMARKIGAELAQKPTIALQLLKSQLTKPTHAILPRIIEDELSMHERTFGRAEVKERIHQLF